MEDDNNWHYRIPNAEEVREAPGSYSWDCMRNAFAAEITELAVADDRGSSLLSGDIGNRLFDDFKDRCPGRFYNCGVAEANMIGMAAGMAMCGLRPVAYTITPFVTTRCLEQIRVDVCYHHVPVTIVGTGGGLSYASLGPTHHSCEDIALLRALPNMAVVCPGRRGGSAAGGAGGLSAAEPASTSASARKARRSSTKRLRSSPSARRSPIRDGREVCLLSTGNMLPEALAAAERLERDGVSTRVASFHTVKPLDTDYLDECFYNFPLVATVEEHSLIGGFGSAVAEWLADRPRQRATLCRFGTRDEFLHESGEQEHAREHFGLTAEQIAHTIGAKMRGRVRAAA